MVVAGVLTSLVGGLLGGAPQAVAVVPSPPAAVTPAPYYVETGGQGPTAVSGTISKDTVWGPAGSPYLLDGQVTVNAGVSLTFLPGTVVKLKTTSSKIVVFGQILSLGTPEDRVRITSFKDDTVGGDDNGDGAATSPGRGDWQSISISAGSSQPTSVIDYTTLRYGGAGSGVTCQAYGTIEISSGSRVVVSNSRITDSRFMGITLGAPGKRGFTGVYDNYFARSQCGVSGLGGAGGEIVGNDFDGDFSVAALYAIEPKDMQVRFNQLDDELVAGGTSVSTRPRASDIDVRFNALLGGIGNIGYSNTGLHEFGPNWFGRDINHEVLPTCLTNDEVAAYQPPIATEQVLCPDRGYLRKGTGWIYGGTVPALSAPPASALPRSLARPYHSTFGPVDTYSGVLRVSADDFVVQDAGQQLTANRVYSSGEPSADGTGVGWRSSYSQGLSKVGDVATMTFGDSSEVPFGLDPAAGFSPSRGVAARFAEDSTGSDVSTPDKTGYRFDPSGQLTSMTLGDPGHKIDVDREDGRVSKVRGVSGREIRYVRGSSGRISSVSDSQGRQVTYTHDSDGRLVSVTGVDGKATTYDYAGSNLTRVTTPQGVVALEAGYDAAGRVSWIKQKGSGRADITYAGSKRTVTLADDTKIDQVVDEYGRLVEERTRGGAGRHVVYDGDGRQIVAVEGLPDREVTGYAPQVSSTFYDRNGNPVREVDAVGGTTSTVFNNRNDPVRQTAPDGGETTYEYDADGRLEKATAPDGGIWRFGHNSRGQVTKITDPESRDRTFVYEANGDLRNETDVLGGIDQFQYDARGLVTEHTDPRGKTRSMAYTAWDQLRRVTTPRGGVYVATFDDDRNLLSVTDPRDKTSSYGYDTQGRVSRTTDAAGQTTTFSYDSLGRPKTMKDPLDRTIARAYDSDGRPTTTTFPDQSTTTVVYDPAGRPMRTTNQLGHVTQTTFNRLGKPTKIETPDGATRRYTYDAAGQLTAHTDATGAVWKTTYDLAGNTTSTIDPLNNTTTATYDKVGRVTQSKDATGAATAYTYDDAARKTTRTDGVGLLDITVVDANGNVVERRDGEGKSTTYAYDDDGLLASQTNPRGGTRHYGYDLAGNRTRQTDETGSVTTATYDDLNRIVRRDHADDSHETFGYDAVGNLTAQTDRRGAHWQHSFDALNRPRVTTDPLGGQTTTTYDDLGQVVKTMDPVGAETRYAYDAGGRPAVLTDPAGNSTVITYDGEGRQRTITSPSGVRQTLTYNAAGRLTQDRRGSYSTYDTDFTYNGRGQQITRTQGDQTLVRTFDARGRLTSFKDGRGKTTTYAYDGADNRTSETSPLGHATVWTYDGNDLLATATDPAGNSASYTRNAAGQLTKITTPGGDAYQYTYDSNGNTATSTNPLGKTSAYLWSPAGDLTRLTRPDGTAVVTAYDELGRPVSRTAGGQTRAFEYDPNGRLTKATAAGVALSFGYDIRGNLTSSTSPNGITTRTYDSDGRVASTALPGTQATQYTYDTALGQLETMLGPTNLRYYYNARGKVSAIRTIGATNYAAQTFTRDANDNVTSLKDESDDSFTATYDDDNRTTSITTTLPGIVHPLEGTTSYTYDAADRLTGWTRTQGDQTTGVGAYTWDSDTNRTSSGDGTTTTSSSFDAANRPTNVGEDDYTYDANGNLAAISGPQRNIEYRYNAFNELTGATSNGQTVSYERDALGRITSRETTGSTTTYGYDSTSNRATTVKKGTTTTAVIRDDTGAARSTQKGSTSTHLIENLHGDVSVQRSNSGGPPVSATLYDPFGTPTAMGAPTVDLAFQAMVTDPITGLTDMGARQYSAASGTFTSEDTVAGDLTAPVTLNRYTYANGSPIDVFDPDGHFGIPKFAKNIASNVAKVASRVYQAVRGVATSVGNAVRAAGGAARATAGSTIGSVRAAARSVQTAASSTLAEARAAAPSMRSFGTAVAELASRVDSTDVHTVLAVAGLVPGIGEVADGADAALYLLEGDTKNALISFAAMVPGIGVGATLGKASVRMGSDAAENLVGAAARRGPPGKIPGGGLAALSRGGRGSGDAYAHSVMSGGRHDGQTVFAGHGEFRLGSGSVTVPEGTTLKVYTQHGERLSQADGLAIELGGGPAPVSVFGPGSVLPNYTLKAPSNLRIASGSTTVEDATQLASLLRPGMGTCHWAACTLVRN